ncbi:hypothetical protein RUM43_002658 [Polyplax serrata]|uniref:Uncharacterized protein n=1 Tax=Polyplax serrata TaxID=468196 RepID=A0AAN8PMN6_POLSC
MDEVSDRLTRIPNFSRVSQELVVVREELEVGKALGPFTHCSLHREPKFTDVGFMGSEKRIAHTKEQVH